MGGSKRMPSTSTFCSSDNKIRMIPVCEQASGLLVYRLASLGSLMRVSLKPYLQRGRERKNTCWENVKWKKPRHSLQQSCPLLFLKQDSVEARKHRQKRHRFQAAAPDCCHISMTPVCFAYAQYTCLETFNGTAGGGCGGGGRPECTLAAILLPVWVSTSNLDTYYRWCGCCRGKVCRRSFELIIRLNYFAAPMQPVYTFVIKKAKSSALGFVSFFVCAAGSSFALCFSCRQMLPRNVAQD